ncbi:MAG TPA: NAD(P)/FAD-dependent oxidoreductase [Acetobacteraceae bacterium]|nr:NAD(P)/FAD-dependent oxidoreductase [Acetobacteraceae bacterium]
MSGTGGSPFRDPKSIAGKQLPVEETTQLLVVGAGPAGVAAAAQAARLGIKVVLADENPVPASVMGDDIPLHFGQRFSAAARNRTAMLEAFIARDPTIAELFDAGVDVRLGTSVWGIYANGPSVGWLPGPVAGLQDGERCFMLGCNRVIVAAGRRDMGLAFPGWELPGVLGITAAQRLLERYGALDVRRAVVLGTSAEALAAARSLRAGGVEIAALIETASAAIGPDVLLPELADIRLLCRHTVRRGEGGPDGVEAVIVAPLDPDGVPLQGRDQRIACDAVLLGVGAVPVIELLDALGCRIEYSAERGCHVPIVDGAGRTSVPSIYAIGDCAGIWPTKTLNPATAEAEGRRAATDVAASLGIANTTAPTAEPPTAEAPGHDIDGYRLDWVRATVVEASGEPYVCQCEEVTAREILELRPPRYLAWPDDGRNTRTLRQMLGDAPPNPDLVKRLTRAGMGVCQGRRCREQVAALLALGAGVRLRDIPLASHRAPVRPIPLSAVGETNEPAAMTRHWDTWFGMPSQYVPWWDAPQFYTVADRSADDEPPEGK